jgi:hypothetical protein
MDIYRWLFRNNSFKVSTTGYFVYCNGDTDKEAFNGKLVFDIKVIPYIGEDSWINPTISAIHKCLNSVEIPIAHPDCDFCAYNNAVNLKIHANS